MTGCFNSFIASDLCFVIFSTHGHHHEVNAPPHHHHLQPKGRSYFVFEERVQCSCVVLDAGIYKVVGLHHLLVDIGAHSGHTRKVVKHGLAANALECGDESVNLLHDVVQ